MDHEIDAPDAARPPSETGRRRAPAIPVWFWWGHAVLIVALAAAIESGRRAVVWIGIAVFVAGSLAIDVPASRAARARPHPGSARRTLVGVAAFMAAVVGVSLATGFGLRAAGVSHPGTIAATVGAVVFAVGGQTLVWDELAKGVRR